MNLIKQLRNEEQFSNTEKSILHYMLEHRHEISQLSARELAERTYTSSATVVRFCKRLGFRGYADFKVCFVAESMQTNIDEGEHSITNKDTVPSIIEKVTMIERNALQETKNDIDPAGLVRTAYLVDRAEAVDFYAIDNNQHIADIASYALLHVGKRSTSHHEATALYLQAMNSNKKQLAFLISRTGENRKLIDLADILRQRHTNIVLMTGERNSTLVQYAREVLLVATEHQFEELENFIFLTGAKFLTDMLFSVIMAHHYEEAAAQNELYGKLFSRSN